MFFRIVSGCLFLAIAATTSYGVELFRDPTLTHGFNLSAVTSSAKPVILGPVLQNDPAQAPVWRLAQWGTQHNLHGATSEIAADGTRTLENAAKRVVIHPGGIGGEGVTLSVFGSVEYGGKLRKKAEPWPHLLIEQRFHDFSLANYERLDFSLNFRVLRCDVVTTEPVTQHLHTGQITAFFAVHNKNKDSDDFNDMIWFGLPIFDARFDMPKGHQAVDGGKDDATGKFICTLPGSQFYDQPTGNGNWHELRADLVPLIKAALAASQAKGFLTASTFEDLYPSSFNLGWEVPGPYDCEIHLKGLSLMGAEK